MRYVDRVSLYLHEICWYGQLTLHAPKTWNSFVDIRFLLKINVLVVNWSWWSIEYLKSFPWNFKYKWIGNPTVIFKNAIKLKNFNICTCTVLLFHSRNLYNIDTTITDKNVKTELNPYNRLFNKTTILLILFFGNNNSGNYFLFSPCIHCISRSSLHIFNTYICRQIL